MTEIVLDVQVVAKLRLPDGRVFVVTQMVERRDADGQVFWWTDGNAGCDCNRSSFLNEDYGIQLGEPEGDGFYCLPCGETITLVSLRVGGHYVVGSASS